MPFRPGLVTGRLARPVRSRRSQISTTTGTSPSRSNNLRCGPVDIGRRNRIVSLLGRIRPRCVFCESFPIWSVTCNRGNAPCQRPLDPRPAIRSPRIGRDCGRQGFVPCRSGFRTSGRSLLPKPHTLSRGRWRRVLTPSAISRSSTRFLPGMKNETWRDHIRHRRLLTIARLMAESQKNKQEG